MCPRCGYDQRGVISAWHETCPLDGTCTECGYEFQWRELLSPILVLPPWCVEASARLRRWPRQFVATAVRCWIPSLLWRRLQAFHLIQRHRLAAWLATWLAVFVIVTLVNNGVRALSSYNGLASMRAGWGPAVASTIPASPIECVLQAMFLPLKNTSMGSVTTAGGAVIASMPSPRSLLQSQMRQDAMPFMFTLLVVPMCCGLTFAALPISRRRAKVKWAHIQRAAIYALGVSFTLVCMLHLRQTLGILDRSPGPAMPTSNLIAGLDGVGRAAAAIVWWLAATMQIAFIPVTFAFWHACVKHYLRMQHAAAVALSVTIIGLLAPIAMLGAMWVMLDFRLRF